MNLLKTIAFYYRRSLTWISPKLNTAVIYRSRFGKKLDLKHPETLNEKILWLKFNSYWNNQLVKQCADKYTVRQYVEEAGCGSILNELIGAYHTPEEIDWNSLPDQIAVKLNIGCGYNYIIHDMSQEDLNALKAEIRRWMKAAPRYYLGYSEMQYKDVKPIILIERYLGGINGELPEDYKFYCMNGRCYMTMFCKDRDRHGHGAKYFFMDRDWNMITNSAGVSDIPVERSECFEQAMEIAEKLSKPFPFVRVDLYLLNGKIIFGEMTFTPAAGMDVDHKLRPFGCEEDIDHIYGRKLIINQ